MGKCSRIEVILWSIALPGFGQILNGKLLKGFLFIGLEFLVNVQSKLNVVIISSFQGDIEKAIHEANYQWLMFYPCVYVFAMWDAYKDAGGGTAPYDVVPLVFGAYFGTIGVIYSSNFNITGIFFGPVWLGIAGFFVGMGIGKLAKYMIMQKKSNR